MLKAATKKSVPSLENIGFEAKKAAAEEMKKWHHQRTEMGVTQTTKKGN